MNYTGYTILQPECTVVNIIHTGIILNLITYYNIEYLWFIKQTMYIEPVL